MRKLIAGFVVFFATLAFATDFTITTPTSAIGAGTPSQSITLAITGTTGSTTSLALTDGGAGGLFCNSTSTCTASGSTTYTIASGTNGSTQFVYTPPTGASGLVTLQAVATGGLSATHILPLPIATNATVAALDNFSCGAAAAGTPLVGCAPTTGGAWNYYNFSGTITAKVNGSNGMYASGTGAVYTELAVPTHAATANCDVSINVSNASVTKTYPGVAWVGSTANSLNLYWLTWDGPGSTGWNFNKYAASSATLEFTDNAHQTLAGGGAATIQFSMRAVNGSQYVFSIVNGVEVGHPVADSTWTCTGGYGGMLPYIASGQTPASTDTVYSNFAVKNADWAATGAITSVPSTIPASHSGNITLTLTGTGTAWENGTTTFAISGVSGVTKVSQNITSTTAATLVVTTSSTTGTLTVSDGTLSGSVAVSTPAISISPTSGNAGTTPSLTLTGTNTLWSSETLSGLFTVSGGTGASLSGCSVSSNTAGTCTLTVGSAGGAETITDTSTGKTATFTATAPPLVVTFPNANIFQSAYNWRNPGDGTAWAPSTGGAYLKFKVTGTTSILANVDTTINSCPATDMPFVKVFVNDLPGVFVQLGTSATQITLASALTSGSSYSVVVYASAGGVGCGNGWSATNPQLHLQSLQFDASAALSAYPIIRSKNCLVLGDSYLSPYFGQTYSSGTTPWYNVIDPSISWAQQMAYAMDCEVGIVGIGSQGYTSTGNNSYPVIGTSWDHYDSTHARSFSPAPDYVINAEGINDHGVSSGTMQTDVQTWLTAARSALPGAKIFLYIPTGGQAGDETGTGGANATPIRNAVTAQADANVFLIDSGTALVTANNWVTNTWFNTPGGDAIHPAQTSHGVLSAYAAQAMQKAIGGTGTTVTPIVTSF